MEVEEHLVGAVEGGEGWALAAVGEGEGSGVRRQSHCYGRRRWVMGVRR
jgi:hypothetical protein